MAHHLHLFILNEFSDLCPSLSVTRVPECLKQISPSITYTKDADKFGKASSMKLVLNVKADRVTISVYRNHSKDFLLRRLRAKEKKFTSATVYIVSHGGDGKNLCTFSARDRERIDLPELVRHLPVRAGDGTVSLYWDACRSGASSYDSGMTMPSGPRVLLHMGTHRKEYVKQVKCFGEASFLESAYMQWFDTLFKTRSFELLTATDPINMGSKLMLITTAANLAMFEYEMAKTPAEFAPPFPEGARELYAQSMLLQANFAPLDYAKWKALRQLALLQTMSTNITALQGALATRRATILRLCRQTLQVYMNALMKAAFEKHNGSVFALLRSETCMEPDQIVLEDAMRAKASATAVKLD